MFYERENSNVNVNYSHCKLIFPRNLRCLSMRENIISRIYFHYGNKSLMVICNVNMNPREITKITKFAKISTFDI